MNVEEAIRQRRSVRSYSTTDVKHDDLIKILSLARYAPSSGNIQNWVFIVVRDGDKKREIAKACLNQIWMVQAPVHIIICNDLIAAKRAYGDRGEKLYSIQNCAAAAQNIMLAAESLGLSTCWVGSFDTEGIKRIMDIPQGINPEIIITLGYKTGKPTSIAGRHDLSHMIFFDDWGNKKLQKSLLLERAEEAGKEITEKVKEEVKKKGIIEKIKKAVKK